MKLALLAAASALCSVPAPPLPRPRTSPDHQSPKPGTANETMSAVKDATLDWSARFRPR